MGVLWYFHSVYTGKTLCEFLFPFKDDKHFNNGVIMKGKDMLLLEQSLFFNDYPMQKEDKTKMKVGSSTCIHLP